MTLLKIYLTLERSFQINMPKVETFNKDYVIDRATQVFHNKGYNATSMQDLVEATGLNRSSIYNSFQNKLNLFILCLKAYQSSFMLDLTNKLDKADDALQSIGLILEFYLDIILSDQADKGCLITNCTSEMANQEPAITNFLMGNKDSFLAFLEDLIKKGQKETVINAKQSARAYALYLFSCIQGFRTSGILISNKSDLQSIAKTTIQTLI